MAATSPPPYALEVSPESVLTFIITRDAPADATSGEGASRCTMTLHHPGNTREHLAFKVKTTQPRRYLVRPNQGLVAPGSSETVSILLVDKDRQVLLSTYDRLGQSALDHSKDKFLVQSCAVSDDFALKFKNQPKLEGGQFKKDLVEALTAMWNSAASGNSVPVFNKKLHVKHSVDASAVITSEPADASPTPPGLPASFREGNDKRYSADNMSPEQLYDEVVSLRRKYDELVAFSVNLTAERDILNNTLEQTKRDLNRETATRAALEKQGFKAGARPDRPSSKPNGGMSLTMVLLVAIVAFFAAIKAANSGSLVVLTNVPVLSDFLGFESMVDTSTEGATEVISEEL